VIVGTQPPYTTGELMAVLHSREVRDFETVATGALSPIPAAGCILAEQTHAPHATFIILGSQEYYPYESGTHEFHFMAQRGDLDLFFVSGVQIDREGNFNLHVVGDYKAPDLRMPGAYGSALIYYLARRVVLFRTEHTRRTFVEKVDFITATGTSPDSVSRVGGPSKVITPMATLSFDKGRKRWDLESVHPGTALEAVLENTGFELAYPDPVPVTPAPTEEELRVLRSVVREKLSGIYPDFAARSIRPETT